MATKFSAAVVANTRTSLARIAAILDECEASLERPADAQDADLILGLLDELRKRADRTTEAWADEQFRVFPETAP